MPMVRLHMISLEILMKLPLVQVTCGGMHSQRERVNLRLTLMALGYRFHRNMTRPFFSKDRISDFDNFERHAAATIALMKARLREGHPVEFQVCDSFKLHTCV